MNKKGKEISRKNDDNGACCTAGDACTTFWRQRFSQKNKNWIKKTNTIIL